MRRRRWLLRSVIALCAVSAVSVVFFGPREPYAAVRRLHPKESVQRRFSLNTGTVSTFRTFEFPVGVTQEQVTAAFGPTFRVEASVFSETHRQPVIVFEGGEWMGDGDCFLNSGPNYDEQQCTIVIRDVEPTWLQRQITGIRRLLHLDG